MAELSTNKGNDDVSFDNTRSMFATGGGRNVMESESAFKEEADDNDETVYDDSSCNVVFDTG